MCTRLSGSALDPKAQQAATHQMKMDNTHNTYWPGVVGRQMLSANFLDGNSYCHIPDNCTNRVILRFEANDCCGASVGLYDDVLPPQIAARGVTAQEWKACVQRLDAVQNKNCGSACHFGMNLTVVGLAVYSLIQGSYNTALAAWVDELNQQVLVPRGMWAKFQTAQVCVDEAGRDGKGEW